MGQVHNTEPLLTGVLERVQGQGANRKGIPARVAEGAITRCHNTALCNTHRPQCAAAARASLCVCVCGGVVHV